MRRFVLLFMLLAGCASAREMLPPDVASSIPEGACKVVLESDLDQHSLYRQVARSLQESGFVLEASDPVALMLQTDWTDTYAQEASRTGQIALTSNIIRIMVVVDTTDGRSLAIWSGQWRNLPAQGQACWTGSDSYRGRAAFASIVLETLKVPHVGIRYE